ncbi:DUF2177 family protein [Oceanomicrobium pacificus]|uniref:DUF2177 family protein n=1 Tax=Oceanomicrobium pacificus TaxID=2692916 RepID=A0A6B0TV96_9RHOB|nr:DUF2177 family protein [Oceanomicrobium pacificus]MXU65142.1 DUF2177 family protein [Oceanomicrobium pacificus]
MTAVWLYLVSVVIFLGLDAIGLPLIVKPVFDRYVGDMLRDQIAYVPALIFYLFYIAGLVWFVSWPALREGTILQAGLNGAFFGAVAYGTYEFTNYATLKGWSPAMVATDLIWGTAITAIAAMSGVAIIRAFA